MFRLLVLLNFLVCTPSVSSSFNPEGCRHYAEVIDGTWYDRMTDVPNFKDFDLAERELLSRRAQDLERFQNHARETLHDADVLERKGKEKGGAGFLGREVRIWATMPNDSIDHRLAGYFPSEIPVNDPFRNIVAIISAQWKCSEFQAAFMQELYNSSFPPNRPVENPANRIEMWSRVNLRPKKGAAGSLTTAEVSAKVLRRAIELASSQKLPRNIRWMLLHDINFQERHGLLANGAFEYLVGQVDLLERGL